MARVALKKEEVDAKRREFLGFREGFVEELVTLPKIATDLPEAGELTEERRRGAAALGFGLEMLQSSFLVEDDIMDKSETRRNKPCWYRVDGVGMMAVNDASMLECIIYDLLKNHCYASRNFLKIWELFQETRLKTIAGQCLDGISELERGSRILDQCTMDRYRKIIVYKTAYYSFHCPMISGMLLAGEDDSELIAAVGKVLLRIGEYFQTQDDYLDCYGDVSVTGKVGTDIQDGKCTWLLVKALEIADQAQKQILEENYGQKSTECVGKVKQVYEELNIQDAFKSYEERTLNELRNSICSFDAGETVSMLLRSILNLIKRRDC
ncbi:unnamed protein product [Notodromas monacha]|uniref:Farnesyl pyrophosphate synthase n=1 Tax=Notodromas monacha TaxID=399045 RepID=A0A7R9C2K8_9CRUS|nr:unnamed protein product [Notodromas monacha]CAG0925163.1 unnamed protein product [Notodromas monacha]